MSAIQENRWSESDMIAEAVYWWGNPQILAEDCRVIEDTDGDGNPYLMVLHEPTGRTSDEAGDAGRWHLDGTSCSPLPGILADEEKRR